MPQTTLVPAAGFVPPARAAADRRSPGVEGDALWRRLAHHAFDDPGDAHPFSARLAQEQGWSAAHTRRVLHEYRRFLLLSIRLRGQACPSPAVDAAWHAHLLDSRRYFDQFCPQVLGRTLHHHPSRGGADGARHRANYAATLHAYERLFGQAPPAELWPPPEARFAERLRQVSPRTHWVVPKPAWWPSATAPRRAALALRAWALLLCLPVLAVVGCAPRHVGGPENFLTGPEFLRLYSAVLLGLVVIGLARAWHGRGATVPVRGTGPLDAVDQAYLAGGAVRAAWVALVRMLQRDQLRLAPEGQAWQAVSAPGAGAHPLECALYPPLARGLPLHEAIRAGRPTFDRMHHGLHARGCLTHPERDGRAWAQGDRLLLVAWVAVLLWGEARTMQGWERGYPVGGLLLLMALSLVTMLLFSRHLPARRTREGRALLRAARQRLPRRRARTLADPLLPLGLALLGLRALGPDLQAVRQALEPITQNQSGSSGCGGSDSGGGGGGDGGGDGGCGGCG
ncbi:MAG: TIGR04222 domain-containing membrane protein [Proteobacteria bacterium]|nr:TIGR04222 domain-containing membrane protein [Pseudomonadota bacterium]